MAYTFKIILWSTPGMYTCAVVQVLRHFIKNVLEAAHKRKLKTLAIPAVGTGALEFPADVVARCMFNECDKFSASHAQTQTTLSEVRLIVYEKDQKTFDVRLTLLFTAAFLSGLLRLPLHLEALHCSGPAPPPPLTKT